MQIPTNPRSFAGFRVAGCTAAALLAAFGLFLAYQPAASARGMHVVAKAEHPIAVVAIPLIVNELMLSDRYVPDRERLQEQFNERIEEIEAQLGEIVRRYEGQSPNPDDPRVQEDQRRYQRLGQQLTNLRREAATEFERLTAKQLLDAYALARSAAQGVAEDLGYDYAIASVSEDEALEASDTSAAVRQMMARPMFHYPDKADITADVRAELRL